MNWQTTTLPAALYDFAVHNPLLSRLGARALWNYDIDHLHQSIAAQPQDALTRN